MKVPYSWLKELVDIDISPEKLSDDLASIGLEVEKIDSFELPDGLVVAEVLSVEKHPNADRLSLCKVNIGDEEPLQIVCGAPNVAVGMKSPLATVGCRLAPDFVVKKSKIRGIKSSGMLCSEKEIAISDDNDGIMSLPENFVVGKQLREYYPKDYVLTIELTPNRGDCLSILGVAREVKAKYGKSINMPNAEFKVTDDSISEEITVEVQNYDGCPRYTGRLIKDVSISESPAWLKQRLNACGIRSINNVVDITNYIMLLFGQPMHSFDFEKISGKKIIVKNAQDNSKFVTLDDVERNLTSNDLVIFDNEKALALAGVMGGTNSGITSDTKDIFLECAYFNPVMVRKTSKRFDLSSDSSYRFERGVDYGSGLENALDVATSMVADIAGGKVCSGKIDLINNLPKKQDIAIRPKQASRLLGVTISKNDIISMLDSLNIEYVKEDNDKLFFTPPTYRHDLEIEVDLIEEVGRLYGYDNIPTATTAYVDLSTSFNTTRSTINTIRLSLAHLGINEAVTNNMTSEEKRLLVSPNIKPVEILNPISPKMAQLRTTVLTSLLDVVSHNIKRKSVNNKFFEIGKIFESKDKNVLPNEKTVISIILEGDFQQNSWLGKSTPTDFFTLKAILQNLAKYCGLNEFSFSRLSESNVYGVERAIVNWNDKVSGNCGAIKKEILSKWNIKTPVYYAELDITELIKIELPKGSYTPLPKYPGMSRDFCFVMSPELVSSAIKIKIFEISDLVESVDVFDVYMGDKLGENKKSVAFSVNFRDLNRTLTDSEIEKISKKIIETMKSEYNAVLRT